MADHEDFELWTPALERELLLARARGADLGRSLKCLRERHAGEDSGCTNYGGCCRCHCHEDNRQRHSGDHQGDPDVPVTAAEELHDAGDLLRLRPGRGVTSMPSDSTPTHR